MKNLKYILAMPMFSVILCTNGAQKVTQLQPTKSKTKSMYTKGTQSVGVQQQLIGTEGKGKSKQPKITSLTDKEKRVADQLGIDQKKALSIALFLDLLASLPDADIKELVDSTGTILAFTNNAINKAIAEGKFGIKITTVEDLKKPENKDIVFKLLAFHLLPEKKQAGELQGTQELKNLRGKPLTVVQQASGMFTLKGPKNTVKLLKKEQDITIKNGKAVLHKVNAVILPADLTGELKYSYIPVKSKSNNKK